MAKALEERRRIKKKTSIGKGKHTKYKSLGSSGRTPKGYKRSTVVKEEPSTVLRSYARVLVVVCNRNL